jgi:DNA-binding transcriptional MerR regulator
MGITEKEETQKLYYSITEVSEMFELNASTLRFWEKEFDVLKPTKNKKGNRLFTPEDLSNLKIIFHLVKERGYTLEGAKKKLAGNKNDIEIQMQLKDTLTRMKGFLTELKESL